MADYSCDIQTEGAVSVEPSGSYILFHGGNNETHNQVLQDISPQNSDNERTNPPPRLHATPLHQTGPSRQINTDNEGNLNEFDNDAIDEVCCEDEDEGTMGPRSTTNLPLRGSSNFIMKNGCCRECMKAFSKTGKVSLNTITSR